MRNGKKKVLFYRYCNCAKFPSSVGIGPLRGSLVKSLFNKSLKFEKPREEIMKNGKEKRVILLHSP